MIPGLAPWEMLQLFQAPTMRVVACPAVPLVAQVAAANANRWALIIANSQTTASLIVAPTSTIAVNTGIILPLNSPIIFLTLDNYGPLVTCEWSGSGNGGIINASVIEVVVNQWPHDTARNIILPWEADDRKEADRTQRELETRKAALRVLMQQSGQLSQRWRNNGAF